MSPDVQAVSVRDLASAQDFVQSAGFAGVVTLVAAVIVLCAVLYGFHRAGKRSLAERDQRERHHEEMREDAQRAVAVARCWDRWWQVLQTAAIEPSASEGATLGLGPEVTLVVLRGLLREAEELGDDTLAKAVAVYQEQLLLVLAQQSGPLSRLAAPTAPSTNGGPSSLAADKQPSNTDGSAAVRPDSEPEQRPAHASAASAAPKPASAETSSATDEEPGAKGRHR
jgi:hypothetical protein